MRPIIAACLFAVSPVAVFAATAPSLVEQAIADPSRPAEQRAADAFRKPAATIAFAGIRPGMAVGEFYPGGGYFTRMLSAVVGPSGHI